MDANPGLPACDCRLIFCLPQAACLPAAQRPPFDSLWRQLHSFKPKGTKQANLSEEEKELMKKTVEQLKLTLDYMGVEYDKATQDKQTLAVEILRQKQLQAIRKAHGGESAANLQKNLQRDEARLMHRDVEELRALLDYMEVEYDRAIDSKARLVGLIINQKRLGDAAKAVQKVFRERSDEARMGHGKPPMGKRGPSLNADPRPVDVA